MHLKIFIIIAIIFVVFNMIAMAQPFNNLTDRELLIQLYSKLEGIEEDVNKMVNNSDLVQRNIYNLDKRITKNETNIESFCKVIDDIMSKWNTLLAYFLTLLVAVIVALVGRFINGRKVKA